MPQPQNESLGGDFRQNFDIMVGLMTIFAFPVVIWTTQPGTWGTRYLGKHALFGFLWPLVFGGLYGRDPGLEAVVIYWQLSIVALLIHRVQGVLRRRRGYRCHSLFWGESLLERGDSLKSQRSARVGINLIVGFVGLLCHDAVSRPLGVLLMLGAFAKCVTEALTFQATEARLRQMEDARIENEYYLDLFRKRRGEF